LKLKHRKKRTPSFPVASAQAGSRPTLARSTQILSGVSLVAASLLPGMVHAAACLTIANNTTLFGSTDCIEWTGGNFLVTGTGTLSGADIGLHASGTISGRTLTNLGTIVGTLAGLQNDGVLAQVQNAGLIWSNGTGVTVAGILNTGSGSITNVVNNAGGSIPAHAPGSSMRAASPRSAMPG
jgi:hypothetical protein